MRIAIASILLMVSCSCAGLRSHETPEQRVTSYAYRVIVDCDGDKQPDVLGSATAIGPRTFLTARHVAEACPDTVTVELLGIPVTIPAPQPDIWLRGTDLRHRPVKVAALSAVTDVAVLELRSWYEEDSTSWAPIRRAPMHVGDLVVQYAGDGDLQFVWKTGYVSSVSDEQLLISEHGVPGNSGAGLFDSAGRLVGVLHSGRWDASREFFVLASPVKSFMMLLGR